jgi:hypothetical protein
MSLEDLERELYARTFDVKKKRDERPDQAEPAKPAKPTKPPEEPPLIVRDEWVASPRASKGGGIDWSAAVRKLYLFGGGILALGVVALVVFLIGFSGRGGGNVLITIDSPASLYRGVPFDVTIGVTNQQGTILRSATLSLTLPEGLVAIGGVGDRGALVSKSLGDIGSGVLTQQVFKVLPVGDVRSVFPMVASVSYGTGGRARFEASESREVTIDQSALTLEVKDLDKVISGSTFTADIEYANVSGFDFSDVSIKASYPSVFTFKSASLSPDADDNEWRLGELKAGSKGSLSITGSIAGPDGARYGIPISLVATFGSEEYTLIEKSVDVAISPAPISISATVNGSPEYVARIGGQLVYSITYKNTSGIALADVVIRASLAGDLLDKATVATDGQFDATAMTVLWNASNIPDLRLLAPDTGGTVNVAVKLLPSFPIRRMSDKNYTVRCSVTVDSPSVPSYLTDATETSATANFDTKVGGLVRVDATALYRDARSGLVNLGSLPPKVGQATEYTLHWIVTNYSTDVKDVSLSTFLSPGVEWTGQVKSNAATAPSWNERTREITWTIDRIIATKGIVGDPVEAVFQVRATPTYDQVGRVQPLLTETTLSATDEFTGASLSVSDSALTTALPDDTTVGQNAGVVVP